MPSLSLYSRGGVTRRAPALVLAGVIAVSSVLVALPSQAEPQPAAQSQPVRAQSQPVRAQPQAVRAEPKNKDSANGKLVMVMDSSGSMKEKTGSGERRIDAAKKALNNVIDKLPKTANVGLRVYGSKVFAKTDPGACEDTHLVVPVGPADKPALKREVQKYKPYGETPISQALRGAAKDLGSRGQRTIVLVSDGEPTCKPDPCKVAVELSKQGIDLKIDVVGLDVNEKARRQLQCVADKGNGVYYDAKSSDDLALSLTRTSLRAFRPFTVAGKPIKGTLEKGSAPQMAPGQYTDTLGGKGSKTGKKYYKLPYSKGSTMHVAATARPPKSGDDISTDGIQMKLFSAGGEDCGFGGGNRVDTRGSRGILNATLLETPSAHSTDACKTADSFVLEVERKADSVVQSGESADVPIELVYNEEPPVSGLSSLPKGYDADDLKGTFVNAKPSKTEVLGGASFNDAAELQEGTVNDTLQSGEMLFYKVKAEWGQAPAVTFAVKADPRAKDVVETSDIVSVEVYGPDRHKTAVTFPGERQSAYDGHGDDAYDVVLPPVRYRNREAPGDDTKAVSRAGYYYFAIALGHQSGAQNYELPMTISTQLKGEKGAPPKYTKAGVEPGGNPNPDASKSAAPGSAGDGDRATGAAESSSSNLPLLIGIIVAVVVIGGLVFFLVLRRRGGSGSDDGHGLGQAAGRTPPAGQGPQGTPPWPGAPQPQQPQQSQQPQQPQQSQQPQQPQQPQQGPAYPQAQPPQYPPPPQGPPPGPPQSPPRGPPSGPPQGPPQGPGR